MNRWPLVLFFCWGCANAGVVRQSDVAFVGQQALMALEVCQRLDASRWASKSFQRAQEACHRAQMYYRQKLYSQARAAFEACLQWAEKAEEQARIQKHRQGDVL